jgi:xanthine dehydrogenase accessory factor
MFDVAEDVAKWRAEGKTVHVAQVVATRGFSSRDPAAALAWTDDGEVAGALVPGLPTDVGVFGTDADGRLVETTVSDDAAVAAGLSCGGVARVFVQDAMAFPAEVWERLAQREPLCLVHEIVDGGSGSTAVYTPATVRSAAAVAADIPRLFARGASATALLTEGEATVAVVALWPPTTLVVVGDGKIADALAAVGVVLGWDVTVTNEAAAAAGAAAALTESDAIVVLSHDRAVDVPALAAVLGGRAGYVGALGSRGTQAARRDGLVALGVSDEQLARIHGPAGLDIDAHTPGEIAVSIVAEVVAARSGTSGGSISRREGPVHTGGVHAPPPRY